jgi:hypothetical protein
LRQEQAIEPRGLFVEAVDRLPDGACSDLAPAALHRKFDADQEQADLNWAVFFATEENAQGRPIHGGGMMQDSETIGADDDRAVETFAGVAFERAWRFVERDPFLVHNSEQVLRNRLRVHLVTATREGERDLLSLATVPSGSSAMNSGDLFESGSHRASLIGPAKVDPSQ